MKNYRMPEPNKAKDEDKINRISPAGRKTYSPTSNHLQTRMIEYQSLAKKAKDQLKQFEMRRKGSPDLPNGQREREEKAREKIERDNQPTPISKPVGNPKTLQHTHSHKTLKRQPQNDRNRLVLKQETVRPSHYESIKQQKLSADAKLDSPRKKHYIETNEYKKLHEKLDLIEDKITEMKKNLQKKKEEKQKNNDNKHRTEKQNGSQKKGGLRQLVTKVAEPNELHTFNTNPYSPRHNVYYVSELVRAYQDQRSLARQHLETSLTILKTLEKSKRLSPEEIKKMAVDLPRKKGYEDKKTIVLDLDQTLIHCNDSLNPPYDVKLPIKFPTGETVEAGINIRPYSHQLLKNLSKFFQIIIFTASHSCYANVVIDYLDPNRQWVHHRLFREHCYCSPEGMYVKDLRIINRDLKSMLLVDNAAYSYAYQLQNGVPILPYYHGSADFQLKMLEQYLMKFVFSKDVRDLNQATFHLSKYKQYYSGPEKRPQKLVQQLYLHQ